MKTLGVLRTTPGTTGGVLGNGGSGENPVRYALIPDRILRNDGFHDPMLVEGHRYRFHRDSVGWLLTREDDRRPHLYLCDMNLEPARAVELAHTTLFLQGGREYWVEQDEVGAWIVLERAEVPSAR